MLSLLLSLFFQKIYDDIEKIVVTYDLHVGLEKSMTGNASHWKFGVMCVLATYLWVIIKDLLVR